MRFTFYIVVYAILSLPSGIDRFSQPLSFTGPRMSNSYSKENTSANIFTKLEARRAIGSRRWQKGAEWLVSAEQSLTAVYFKD